MIVNVQKRGGRETVSVLWESLSEPAAAVATMKQNREAAESYLRGESGYGGAAWFGAEVPVLFDRLKNGWSEGVERLMALPCRDFEATDVRRRRTRADQGDEVDMQSVWRGDLSRAWTRTRRQSRMGFPTVSIVCNLGANAGTGADALFWRGAAVLRLTAALAEAGHNVGIYGACAGVRVDGAKVDVGQMIEIKAPDYPLDLSHLAALTAMPGYFRTSLFAGFAWACDKVGSVSCQSLGTAQSNLKPLADALGLENVILQGDVLDQSSAEAWIESAIREVEARSE